MAAGHLCAYHPGHDSSQPPRSCCEEKGGHPGGPVERVPAAGKRSRTRTNGNCQRRLNLIRAIAPGTGHSHQTVGQDGVLTSCGDCRLVSQDRILTAGATDGS